MTSIKTAFKISVGDDGPTLLPTTGSSGERFSVRQTSAIWFEGGYYLYADIVPWDNPHHPDTYDTSIHLFTSDNAESWRYEGEIISKNDGGDWTTAGVATPGACVFGGRVYVAYSVRGKPDGSGHRFLGISEAEDPRGTFRELPQLRVIPEDVDYSRERTFLLLDDPQLVACNADGTGPGDERLDLYYRRSLNDFSGRDRGGRAQALEYDIRTSYVVDFDAGVWSQPHPVVKALPGGVVETVDARWMEGRLVMIVLGYDNGEMGVYLSEDSRVFVPADPPLLESYLDIFMDAACFRLPGFIPDADGRVRHMTTPGDIDDDGHYTQWVFNITCQ